MRFIVIQVCVCNSKSFKKYINNFLLLDYYPNPESFNPERFNSENGGVKSFKDRFVLIPFGDGPRICLGMKFAYMQVKAGIAAIVKNFDISIDKNMPENLTIGPSEYLNVTDHKLMLNFRRL